MDPTTIIAIYGAALSTTLAAIEVYRFRVEQEEKKPKVEVTLLPGFLSQGRATSPAMLTLTTANVGRQPVTLTGVPSLLLPDTQKVILIEAQTDVQLPYELLPGKSCNFWRDIKQLARTLQGEGYRGQLKIIGEFTDAVGNRYKSKPFPLDIEGWAK